MPSIRRLLLVGHTHHDVGYTYSPRLVDGLHAEIVGRVLDLCDASDDAVPADAPEAFRWTFEVARPVLRFLDEAGAEDVRRLRDRVQQGRVSVTAGYLNMTQLPSVTELDVGYDALDRFRATGLRVRTQQHGDVNGLAWGTVEQMRRAGVTRLLMALNPDHGRPPLPQPSGFWWRGVSGEEVFVWLSTHYGVGEEWGIIDGDLARARARIEDFVARLSARADYPYDVAVVHAANDNRWPTPLFLELVRYWNRAHPELPMRTATVDEALDQLVPQGSGAPVLTGEWSDWWSHGHGSTAREVSVYREARTFAQAAGVQLALAELRGEGPVDLADVIGYRRAPVRTRTRDRIVQGLDHVDEQLLLFGEHTWGSWESYSKPFSTFSFSHWNAKAGFAYAAWDVARDLAVEGMHRLIASGPAEQTTSDAAQRIARGPAQEPGGASPELRVLVTNPTESDRSEPVEVEVDGRERARFVARVPAFGLAAHPLPPPARTTSSDDVSTACGRYQVRVSAREGGIRSLVDTVTGTELVDPASTMPFAAVVVESVRAGSTHPMLTRDPKDFHPDNPGPDFDRLAATGTGPVLVHTRDDAVVLEWTTLPEGLPPARTRVALYADSPFLDIDVYVAKPEAFGPESLHITFPFAFQHPQFLLETAGAVYAADRQQLPDTSKDWYSVQHAVGVGDQHRGVLWGTRDAPLVQLGGFHTGTWARQLEAQTGMVNSWLMNNLHFTNFQARQEGTRTYRYRMTALPGPPTPAQVARFGRDIAVPLQARATRSPARWHGPGGLAVDSDGDLIAEVRPVAGGVRVRLREIAGVATDAVVDALGTQHDVRVPAHGRADVLISSGTER